MNIERVGADQGTDGLTSFGRKTQEYLNQHLRPDTLERHIDNLTTAGFTKPAASIEKHPEPANLDIQRVKSRLRLIQRLNRQFNLNYDPIGIIETVPRYLSYSRDRLFFFLRVGRFYDISEDVYRRLITLNPFLVFSEVLKRNPDNQIQEEVRKICNAERKLSKQEKNERIKEVKDKLSQMETILEGYPENQKQFFLKLARNLERQVERDKKKTTKA